MHFGFKCDKKIADWLSQKPNRSETIRSALRKQMNHELRQLRANDSKKPDYKPISGTHLITLVRLPKKRGFIRGKRRVNCSLKRAYETRTKKLHVRGEFADGNSNQH